jgi:hypothetical protein
MPGYSRTLLAAVAGLALATLTGCSNSTSSDPSGGTGGGPSAGGNTQTAAAAPNPALPTNGRCVLITTDKAAALVGSAVTSSASNVTGEEGIVHVDGCTFVGASSNLGYDVNDFKAAPMAATAFIDHAKTEMAGEDGVTQFDVSGGDASVGFTVAIGPKVMARIEVAKGTHVVAVNSVAPDAETAKKISTGAVALLLAAIG